MTLIRTLRESQTEFLTFGPTGSITSDAFTPSNNSLLVVVYGCVVLGNTANTFTDLTITNSAGLTFTPRTGFKPTSPDFNEYWTLTRIWTAPVTTGASMTVTVDLAGASDTVGTMLAIVDYTGYDTSSPIGVTAAEDVADDGADSIILSGAPAATSEIIGCRVGGIGGVGGSASATPDTGHTELYDLNIADVGTMQVQVRPAGSTSTSFSWADIDAVGGGTLYDVIGVAIEIKEAVFEDPLDIPGCKVWLDADDAATFTYGIGTRVATWTDKSPNAYVFNDGGGGSGSNPERKAAVLNGRSIVAWEGAGNTIRLGKLSGITAIPQPFTVFVVAQFKNDATVFNTLWASGTDNPGVIRRSDTGDGVWVHAGSPSFPSNVFSIVNGQPYYFSFVYNGASSLARASGVAKFTNVNVGTTGIGTTNLFLGFAAAVGASLDNNEGYIAEFIIYDSALSAGDITLVENYLNNKWFVSAGINITGTPATVTVTASTATISATTAITGTPATVAVTAGSGVVTGHASITGISATVTVTAGSGQIQLPVAITGTPATVTVTAGSAIVTGHAAIIGVSATVTVTAGSAAITATTAITGTPATVTVTAGSGVIGINAPDPIKIADRGIRTSTATGNGTITITNPTLITVGNYLVARVAVDNSGASGARPGLVFSDTRNGTWSQGTGGLQDPGAVSAGVAVYLCYVKVAVAYQAGDVFSFAWTTGTPISAIVVEEWANIRQTTPLSVAEVSANNVSSTAQPSISRTPLAVGELVYVAAALEGISSSWGAQDTDTTGGSWGDVTKDQANTGTALTSVSVYGGYKIVTSTAAQTWNNTLGVASDWAAVAVVFAKNIPPTNVTASPGWVTVTAGSAVVAGNAAVVGTFATVSVQAGSGVLTAGTNVTGTSATVVVQAGTGVIQFPTTNITGTSATVVVTAGTGTITGQTNITGTPAIVVVTASTATITGQTNITGTSATVAVTAGTGNIASQINITGTSATVVVTSGTGIVGTILTIVGTSATVVVTAGSGTITGQTNITGTSAIVSVQAGSAVLIGSVIGTSATVTIIAGSGVITAHTAIIGTSATVAITAGTAPILTGSNILGTTAIVSVIAGIGAITAQTNIIALSAIIAVISGVGTITGQANTIGVSAIIAVNAGTGQITAAGSYILPAKQGAILVV